MRASARCRTRSKAELARSRVAEAVQVAICGTLTARAAALTIGASDAMRRRHVPAADRRPRRPAQAAAAARQPRRIPRASERRGRAVERRSAHRRRPRSRRRWIVARSARRWPPRRSDQRAHRPACDGAAFARMARARFHARRREAARFPRRRARGCRKLRRVQSRRRRSRRARGSTAPPTPRRGGSTSACT